MKRAYLVGWLINGFLATAFMSGSAPAQEPTASEKPEDQLHWKFPHERDWLLDEITRDIAEMLLFAKDPAIPVSTALEFTATLPPDANGPATCVAKSSAGTVSRELAIHHYLWAAENYQPWVEALLDGWKITKPEQGPAPDTSLAKRLTAPASTLLVGEGKRLSKELSAHPLDAGLHEQAAVLLGALGLREAAGPFSDTRHVLCRMTAHLAMAHALSKKQGECGQLAEAMQLTLLNCQTEALEKISALPADLQSWANALKMRCTGDWRLLPDPSTANLLEQMEGARALVRSMGAGSLIEFLQKAGAAPMTEWNRIVMDASDFSVQDGHVFVRESLGPEIEEMAEDWNAWFGKPLQTGNLVLIANDLPSRGVVKTGEGNKGMEVLGWGDFAAFHQRHLCHSIERTTQFLRNKWGVVDAADAFDKTVRTNLGALRFYPIARWWRAPTAQDYAEAMREVIELCHKQPELITPWIWSEARQPSKLGKLNQKVPPFISWFTPALHFGTALDVSDRCRNQKTRDALDFAAWEDLRRIAPYDFAISRSWRLKKFGKTTTTAQLQEANAKFIDYNLPSVMEIAESCQDDPAAYQTAMQKACEMNPNLYMVLGKYLADRHLDEVAVAAYQSGVEKARDRVTVSVRCRWLVDYYFDHGRKEDALKIATEAAEVYSYGGLDTMALLMERMEKFDEAVKYFGFIDERYNNSTEILKFYKRRKDSTTDFARDQDKITRQMFPDGISKAQLSDFKGPPKDGVDLTVPSNETATAGLHKGDVIVGLDGYRVRSLPQFIWVRELSTDPHMNLIVWTGSEYQEINVTLPDRRFHCQFATRIGK